MNFDTIVFRVILALVFSGAIAALVYLAFWLTRN